MVRLVIFDMDGTIADTSPGIFATYAHVAEHFGLPVPGKSDLNGVIGGSLPGNLARIYGFNEKDTVEAVCVYRRFYADVGYSMSKLYPGFREAVVSLHESGHLLAVATLKAEVFAMRLVEMWGMSELFSCVCGVDDGDTVTKPDMIRRCMADTCCTADETVMVGDSPQDKESADVCGVDFIAVAYGFNYNDQKCENDGIKYVKSPLELTEVIG